MRPATSSARCGCLATATLLFCLLTHPFLSSCAHIQTDLIEVEQGAYPFFIDDAPADSLIDAIDRHLSYLDKKSVTSSEEFSRSLSTFKTLLKNGADPIELNRLIRNHFHLYKSRGRNQQQEMLVTGYYEPVFNGSLSKTGPYLYPVYGVPETLIRRQQGPLKIGRLDESGRFVHYWTRKEIDTNDLLQGNELVYLKDKLDVYLLQVQGSGRIRLPGGQTRALHFAASNGHQYNSLGKLIVDEGIMTKEEVSVDSIRAYLADNPEELDRMLFHNPRYIFFGWGDDQGPRGSLGQVLTAQRSIAVDHDIFPTGAIGYLVSRRPVLNDDGSINHWKMFGRFVLPQDSGAAIKGPGRVDLFLGNDYYAEKAAGNMKERGSLFFLLPKPPIEKPN